MSENGRKNETKEKALNLLQKLYRSRIKIRKGDTSIVNVSVLFGGLCLLLAPHMTIAGVIVSMILGYQFSFSGMDPEFASDSLEKMVKNAAQNAKSSVSNVVKTITNDEKMKKGHMQFELNINKDDQKKAEKENDTKDSAVFGNEPQELRDQAKELEETMDSFFESNPAATTYHSAYSAAASSVPTIQVPVQTETKEGEVSIDDDQDGFSSVTIG